MKVAVAWVGVLASLTLPGGAAAQTTGLGVYAPGTENQIWQQFSYVGSASCVPDPDSGVCTTPADTALGRYYFPIQIATDVLSAASGRTTGCAADSRIINYVTDQWNHRVQAFDFCGNPVAFPNAPGGWPTIGGGPAGGTMTAGSGGTGLNQPEGITVDAAHHIIVADRNNSRVAISNEDGSFLFEIPVPAFSQPTGVAVLPGTIMDPTGDGRGWLAVLLSASGSSRLLVYDSKGTFIGQNIEDEGSELPGALLGPSGLAVDSAGRVYVADLYNSRIAGYAVDSTAGTVTYEFQFGAPADPSNLQPSDLQYPYSIAIDTLGRLIVGDTGNQRLAVYTISFESPAMDKPSIQFDFYLDARGDLDGYPRGVAQDRVGRLYVVDTTNHRIQRFETPLLAIVNLTTTPAGFVPSGSPFTVTAGVVVPASKAAVTTVVPTIETSGNVTLLSGPDPVAPTQAVPTPQINPGEIAYYAWTYAAGLAGGSASFTVGATGDPNPVGAITAAGKAVTVSLGCAGCETTPPATTATVSSAKTSGIWHSNPTTVSLTTVDAADTGSPSGIREIRLYLTGVESTAALGLPPCAQQYDGGSIEYCVTASGAPTAFSTSISLNVEGSTTVRYRAIDNYGNAETAKSVSVVIDASAPIVSFTPAVAPNAYGWYGAATSSVTVNYTVSDMGSGLPSTVPASGSLTYAQEGDNSRTVDVVDRVGNAYSAPFGVRIDRTAPTILPVGAQTVELATSNGTALTLSPTATDALSGILSVTTNAPAVFPLGTTIVTMTATDRAGNKATSTTTITVRDTTPPVFTVVPAPITTATTSTVGTAATPNVAVLAAATDLEPVTVTQSPAASTPLNPGSYTVTLTATDAAGNKSTTTAYVTVRDLTPATITACAPVATVSIDPATNVAVVPNMTGGVRAIDNGGGPVSVTQAPAAGVTLGLGTYPVAFTVADMAGNVTGCISTLNVVSVLPPTATIKLTPGLLWPPNHKLVAIRATLAVSDPKATVQLVSITSSEPDNGLGDGDKAIDEQTLSGKPIATAYGTDTRGFQLRAERSGTGPGRVYTVTYRITNAAGSILVSGTALVPHDMSNEDDRAAVHSGN